jgi:hypothetical protein
MFTKGRLVRNLTFVICTDKRSIYRKTRIYEQSKVETLYGQQLESSNILPLGPRLERCSRSELIFVARLLNMDIPPTGTENTTGCRPGKYTG